MGFNSAFKGLTEQSASAVKRKSPNTIQTQAIRRYKNFMETLLFNIRELQQGIARWTDTCCGIYGKNTIIAGTSTG